MANRTPTARAIIYAGILGGLSLDQINELLKPLPNTEELDPASYRLNRDSYFGKMVTAIGSKVTSSQNEFGDMIYHPKPIRP